MRLSDIFLRTLSPREQLKVFAIAVALFVFPIIQADYSYYDDAARTLFLGEHLWRSQGRLFMELVQTLVSFNPHPIDVFPLPLLLVLPVLVAALASLSRHYFAQPTPLDTLVVMPLLYTPFILGILNYQYDGPMVLLGVCCVVFALTFDAKHVWMKWGVISVLLAAAAGLYQTTVQMFVCLCCIDCVRAANEGTSLRKLVRELAARVGQLASGLLLYGVTAFQLYTSLRGAVAQPEAGWGVLLRWRAEHLLGAFGTFVNDSNRWLFIAAGVLILAGVLQVIRSIASARGRLAERWGRVLLVAAALIVVLMAVPGPLLFIEDFSLGPRTLIAFSCVTVLVFYLARNVLRAMHPLLTGLLIIPLFGMLSFSYAYGRVLVAQKAFETSVVYSISHDIASTPELRAVEDFYLLPSRPYTLWVPGSTAAAMDAMPALKFMLTVPQITTAERLAMTGITNVASAAWKEFPALTHGNAPEPVINNRFYDIVRVGNVGFIALKAPEGSARYKYREFRVID
ncbi:glucosyltransferase domain-containing protein [Pseudomonas sp. UBA1879]|uniref:glucosyltransferase domain-containing protein n=1 Tax=Pseudomonas sp. UBA1879 TaxID=1947305 RepID=UPI0025F8E6B1|nr:glucosyltransferase domain-containing protein [Pseudomonas sp. UBA1879]